MVMAKKSEWLNKYQLIDVDKVPDVSAPLANTWAKAVYEMPSGKAGRLPVDNYETARSLERTIKGSIRAARQQKWGLNLQLRTKIVAEDGIYVVYFWRQSQ